MRMVKISFMVLPAVFLLLSCATVRSHKAESTEELLSAAGFIMVPAETPEEFANLNSLTPLKVEFSVKDNKPLYWYADPYSCKCVYTGDQAAYDRYQRLRVDQNIADEEQETALMNEQVGYDPNMWGWLGGSWDW